MPSPQSRNALCSCGSKRKFKHCCGKDDTSQSNDAGERSNSVIKSGSGIPLVGWLLGLLCLVCVLGFFFKDALIDSIVGRGSAAFTKVEARESHDFMLAALKAIGKNAEADHPYNGSAALKTIRGLIQTQGRTASKGQLCDWYFSAGLREGRLGNLRKSIEEHKQAYDLLPRSGFDPGKSNYYKFKLGVAYFRLGETENCCITGGPESCIVPIGPEGIHRNTEGSENAIKYFMEILESGRVESFARDDASPNSATVVKVDLAAQWLLNVAHMTLGTYPSGVPEEYLVPESAFQSKPSFPKFKNVAKGLGLDTFDLCGGVICEDFDGDHLLDIVTSTWDPQGQINFFRNKGDGTFEKKTDEAGLTGIVGGLNISQTDFNNDGYIDIFVTRGAWLQAAGQMPNSLLRNNGDGTFLDISFAARLAGLGLDFPTQVSQWADYDNDGDIDLFLGNEHNEGAMTAGCQLFRNNGDETFTNVAKQAGIENFHYTKGASWGDFDNDGDQDIYLSNLRAPNRLYRNNGDGTFTDIAESAGVTKPNASFPTWFFDFDNDGNLDLFVAGYTGKIEDLVGHYCGTETNYEPSCLFKGDGKGNFKNVTSVQGLQVPMLPMGANFGDINNDGFLDFYLGTGDPEYESLTPNMMFLNKGGTKFEDITMGGGFGHLQKGHGIAFADLDNDGDAEVFEQMGGAFIGDKFGNVLFENPGFDNNWIALKLVGVETNRPAIGTKIEIRVTENGQARSIWKTVNSGGSFGANPFRQTIGLGSAKNIDELRIHWQRTGKTQTFKDVAINQFFVVTENKSKLKKLNLEPIQFGSANGN